MYTSKPIHWRFNPENATGMNEEFCPVIYKVGQMSGPDRYSVKRLSLCLTKTLTWEYEPLSSSRTDEFLKACRFDTFKEAEATIIKMYNKYGNQYNYGGN